MAKATVRTDSGKTVSGDVVRRNPDHMTLADAIGCIATLGLVTPPDRSTTTVRDQRGNHWTGKEKR
jgi:hypothetical protein